MFQYLKGVNIQRSTISNYLNSSEQNKNQTIRFKEELTYKQTWMKAFYGLGEHVAYPWTVNL